MAGWPGGPAPGGSGGMVDPPTLQTAPFKPPKIVVPKPKLPPEFGGSRQRAYRPPTIRGGGGGGGRGGTVKAPKGMTGGKGKGGGQGYNFSSAFYDPSKSLSGRDLAMGAQAIADATTKGPLAALALQIARNNAQTAGAQKRTSGYFNQLLPFVQQSAAKQAQISQQLQGQLGQIGQNTQQQIGQAFTPSSQVQQLTGQGLGGDAVSRLAAGQATQQGLAAQNNQTAQQFGANAGALSQGLSASNVGSYGMRGMELLGGIGKSGQLRNAGLTDKEASLIAQRGALKATALGKLRSDERSYDLAKQGLGLKAAGLAATTANNTASLDLKTQLANIDTQLKKAGLSETQRHNLATERAALQRIQKGGGGGGAKFAKPSLGDIPALISMIGIGQHMGQNEATIRRNLQSGANSSKRGYDPALIDAAYAIAGYGYLTPKQEQELRGLGLGTGNYPVQGRTGVGSGVGSGVGGPLGL